MKNDKSIFSIIFIGILIAINSLLLFRFISSIQTKQKNEIDEKYLTLDQNFQELRKEIEIVRQAIGLQVQRSEQIISESQKKFAEQQTLLVEQQNILLQKSITRELKESQQVNSKEYNSILNEILGLLNEAQESHLRLDFKITENFKNTETIASKLSKLLEKPKPLGKEYIRDGKKFDFVSITFATHSNLGICRLLKSAFDNEFNDFKLMAWGSSARSVGHKLLGLKDYLSNIPEEKLDSTIVLFMDGFDTLIQVSPEKMLDKFFSMVSPDKRFFFNAETMCWVRNTISFLIFFYSIFAFLTSLE